MCQKTFTHIRSMLLCSFLTGILYAAPSLADADDVQTITHGKSLLLSCQQTMLALDKGVETLSGANQTDAFLCVAFIRGVVATAQHANELAKLRFAQAPTGDGKPLRFNLYCFNWQLSYQEISHIVLNFGRNNPRYLQRPAHELVIRALQTAFPCR